MCWYGEGLAGWVVPLPDRTMAASGRFSVTASALAWGRQRGGGSPNPHLTGGWNAVVTPGGSVRFAFGEQGKSSGREGRRTQGWIRCSRRRLTSDQGHHYHRSVFDPISRGFGPFCPTAVPPHSGPTARPHRAGRCLAAGTRS